MAATRAADHGVHSVVAAAWPAIGPRIEVANAIVPIAAGNDDATRRGSSADGSPRVRQSRHYKWSTNDEHATGDSIRRIRLTELQQRGGAHLQAADGDRYTPRHSVRAE